MTYEFGNKPKGMARAYDFILCNTCGSNTHVAYDAEADEYICSPCIVAEQDAIDLENEETYRIKGDN